MSAIGHLTSERGTILNEYYTLDEYVSRRCWYLSRLPAFAKKDRVFGGVRECDAAAIYQSEDEVLSVQEVRRREVAAYVCPLLPLPTTGNTRTIDSFSQYGGGEWTPPSQAILPLVSPSGDHRVSYATSSAGELMSTTSVNSHVFHQQISPFDTMQANQTTQAPHVSGQPILGPIPLTNYSQLNEEPDPGIPFLAPSSGQPYYIQQFTHHRAATSGTLLTMYSTPALTLDSSSNRRSQHTKVSSPLALCNHPGVASYASRGISIPVKSRGEKRKKPDDDNKAVDLVTTKTRPFHEVADPTTCVPSSEQLPPRKKLKLNLRNSVTSEAPRPTPLPERTLKTLRPRRTKQPERSSSPVAVKQEKVKTRRRAAGGSKPPAFTTISLRMSNRADTPTKRANLQRRANQPTIDRIISGRLLPSTPEQALQASSQRYDRLLHASQLRPDHSAQPDILPEFHFAHNYTPSHATDVVRCICQCTQDDGGAMIACERCDAWQHIACMSQRSHIPEHPDEDPYTCHVCDPFAHRLFLARWRIDNPMA